MENELPKGFTLVELLITISIISVLSVIGFVIYTSVLKQGRDSKRISDLRSIQAALEQYNNDQGYYPLSLGASVTFGTKTYMTTVPTGSPTYVYVGLPVVDCVAATPEKCTSYCLYADLENSGPGLSGCATNGTNDFAVTPP